MTSPSGRSVSGVTLSPRREPDIARSASFLPEERLETV
jgi:hypothetical protein